LIKGNTHNVDMAIIGKQELLLQLKWATLSVVLLGFVGLGIAVVRVLLFEQTPSGRYAVHKECVLWDEGCIEACDEAVGDDPRGGGISCDCCIKTDEIASNLGDRLKELIFEYSLIGSTLGVVIGLSIAQSIKDKQG